MCEAKVGYFQWEFGFVATWEWLSFECTEDTQNVITKLEHGKVVIYQAVFTL